MKAKTEQRLHQRAALKEVAPAERPALVAAFAAQKAQEGTHAAWRPAYERTASGADHRNGAHVGSVCSLPSEKKAIIFQAPVAAKAKTPARTGTKTGYASSQIAMVTTLAIAGRMGGFK